MAMIGIETVLYGVDEFVYLPCPPGGDAEYNADSDYLDDSWVPRSWQPMHGFFSFITNMAPVMMDAAYTPPDKKHEQPDSADH